MTNLSQFESRSGQLTCRPEELYRFVTDIRNFERFVPQGIINNWQAEKGSCSFTLSMIGPVGLRLAETEINNKVVYNGDALKKNDFSLVINISSSINNSAEVKVQLNADLNPMLKMVAAKPIAQFLETLINEMEGFKEWKDIKG
ncbi:MAG: hypothetical protein LLG13_08280 [Bacteroidales bacterium]|nr:hypothetical protein [Bacteroidales bacterium]